MKTKQAPRQLERPREKGVILIVAILALLAMAIFLPALVFVVSNETKWSVKQKKTTTAFHMAEAGLDRGIWKLQESDAIFNSVSTGGVIPGYNFDLVYTSTDSSGAIQGYYKVKLTTSTTSSRVLVQSMGKDASSTEVRGLQAEYTTSGLDAGLQVRSGLTYKSGTRVHWGRIICYGDIDLPNSPDNTSAFPRKVAKGSIDERPPTSVGGPHGDTTETWDGTYDYLCHSPDLTDPPTIDLDQYREIAKKSAFPANDGATAVPAGSGYFPTGAGMIKLRKPGGNNTSAGDAYVFNNSTSVMFVEDSGGAPGFNDRNKYSQLVVRALIMPTATLSINGDSNIPNRVIRIPDEAQSEYLYNGTHGNATLGWSATQGTNSTNFNAVGAGNNFTVADCLVHGYMYFDNVSNSGTDLVVAGVLDLQQATNPQAIIVYYDQAVSTGILVLNPKPRQVYWREFKAEW